MQDRLEGLFEALVKMGRDFVHSFFEALKPPGAPLWEFKPFDHRMYCARTDFSNGSVQAILLDGWVKDKEGKAKEEKIRIEVAKNLNKERLIEGAKK